MPVNEYVTSANSIESLYITRQEVIDAISTIVPALSSFSTITFGVSPNPSFSTISMPSGGLISGFAPIQTSNVIFTSTTTVGKAWKLGLGAVGGTSNAALTALDGGGVNTAPIQGQSIVARTGQAIGTSVYHQMNATSQQFYSANGGAAVTWLSWNGLTGSPNIAISNISTINGAPVNTNPTTYTSLSGSNITNSGVIATPSMVSLSSLNALPISAYLNSNAQLWQPYTVTNVASYPFSLTSGSQTTVLTFSNVPIPNVTGREVTISVPIAVSLNPVPANNTTIQIDAFIGGSLTQGTQVTQMVTVGPQSLANFRVTLCGVATTNGTQPVMNIVMTASQNVNVIVAQGAGTTPRQFFFQTLGF